MPATRILILLALTLLLSLPGQDARAHGGQTMDEDECKFRLGAHLIHFTGYQPKQRMGEEFCKLIPETGQTILVFDAFNDELRKTEIAVRVVEDIGAGPANDDRAPVIVSVGPERFTDGTISLQHEFPETGDFVGIVTVAAGNDRHDTYTGRFRFSVGTGSGFSRQITQLVIWVSLLGFGVYFLSGYLGRRRGDRTQLPS
jgi:hypothetical protein